MSYDSPFKDLASTFSVYLALSNTFNWPADLPPMQNLHAPANYGTSSTTGFKSACRVDCTLPLVQKCISPRALTCSWRYLYSLYYNCLQRHCGGSARKGKRRASKWIRRAADYVPRQKETAPVAVKWALTTHRWNGRVYSYLSSHNFLIGGGSAFFLSV